MEVDGSLRVLLPMAHDAGGADMTKLTIFIGVHAPTLSIIVLMSIIVGYAYSAYSAYEYEKSLPDNCTVENLRHRMNQLDIIASLPIPSSKSGIPNSVLISKNLQSMAPIRGCNKRTNDALEMTEYHLSSLDFVNYAEWRQILQNELNTMQKEQR